MAINRNLMCVCVCIHTCMCVRQRERDTQRDSDRERQRETERQIWCVSSQVSPCPLTDARSTCTIIYVLFKCCKISLMGYFKRKILCGNRLIHKYKDMCMKITLVPTFSFSKVQSYPGYQGTPTRLDFNNISNLSMDYVHNFNRTLKRDIRRQK